MHFTTYLVLYSMLQAATRASATCAANNCLRAVRASAFPARNGSADCSSYFRVTVSPATATLTNTNSLATITTVEVVQKTVSPSSVPAYASPCSGNVQYSSACSCLGFTHMTTTIAPATLTPTFTSRSVNTSAGYVIVSPTSCPLSTPTGTLIGQSNQNFSVSYGGLKYQQYQNQQFILQDNSSGPFFVDLSSSSMVTISDTKGDTLIIYVNGTFKAFAGNCELEIVGSWLPANGSSIMRRNELWGRQSSELCNDVQLYCNSRISVFLNGAVGSAICGVIGAEIGADVGGAIGFLGNILGPEVGIPTTLLGVALGGRLGAFLAGQFGQILCGGVTSLLGDALCKACPSPVKCDVGTISCNNGQCQDALSDPNNCGSCGTVCPSGICKNSQCSEPVCNGSTCGSLNSCGSGCFCFETSDSTGFCGPNTACAPLADCSSSSECALGEVCATSTCCGRNVCLASCTISVRRGLLLSGNYTEVLTGGQGPA